MAVSAGALACLFLAAPASAGGSWFDPVKDRYEPGDEATLIGYTGGGAYGWIDDGPFFGFLVDSNENGDLDATGERRALGELDVEETGDGGYLRLRASITFTVPADLAPGVYWFDYCNADCTERLGDLIGGVVHVGVDPDAPVVRNWSIDDPEVASLDDTARLSGPGFEVTAGQVRATSQEDEVVAVVQDPTGGPTDPPATVAEDSSGGSDGSSGPGGSVPWILVGLAVTLTGAGAAGAAFSRRDRVARPAAATAGEA